LFAIGFKEVLGTLGAFGWFNRMGNEVDIEREYGLDNVFFITEMVIKIARTDP
jgi:hypothetical protein